MRKILKIPSFSENSTPSPLPPKLFFGPLEGGENTLKPPTPIYGIAQKYIKFMFIK